VRKLWISLSGKNREGVITSLLKEVDDRLKEADAALKA
jgi:hypothetical protein